MFAQRHHSRSVSQYGSVKLSYSAIDDLTTTQPVQTSWCYSNRTMSLNLWNPSGR